MNKAELAPLVRISLYILAGRLTATGWLPEDAAIQLQSPEMVELVIGLVVGAGALAWYAISHARKALASLVS